MRGAAKEIHHERTRNAGACLYFAQAPFVRMMRIYLEEQATLEHPLKPNSGVVGCVQLTLEQTLISILEAARYVVRRTSKKKADNSPSGRSTLLARDVETVLVVLAHRHPILHGRLRPVLDDAAPPGHGGAHPKAKAAPKAKAKAAAKAKAKAKAKAG